MPEQTEVKENLFDSLLDIVDELPTYEELQKRADEEGKLEEKADES